MTKKIRFDGDSFNDRLIWNSYLYTSREMIQKCGYKINSGKKAMIDDQKNRLSDKTRNSLTSLVFTAFCIEYRIKRVLTSLKVKYKSLENISDTIELFKERLETKRRIDNGDLIILDQGWNKIKGSIIQLLN